MVGGGGGGGGAFLRTCVLPANFDRVLMLCVGGVDAPRSPRVSFMETYSARRENITNLEDPLSNLHTNPHTFISLAVCVCVAIMAQSLP